MYIVLLYFLICVIRWISNGYIINNIYFILLLQYSSTHSEEMMNQILHNAQAMVRTCLNERRKNE